MSKYNFKTDKKSEAFCDEIISCMTKLFDISSEEAIGRINKDWAGLKLVGKDDLIYHEEPEYWAKTIYYGKESCWWLGEEGLTPRPFP